MSSILSAQNLHTLRRRNIGRRCACPFSPVFLSPALPRAPPDRPCPNAISLRSLVGADFEPRIHVVFVFSVARASLARLADGRKAALDTPPLGIALALGARAIDDLLL